MNLQLELPDTYADKLDAVSAVDPTIEDQLEVELTAAAMRLINDAHRQLSEDERDSASGQSTDATE